MPSGFCRYSVGIFEHRAVQRLYLCATTNLLSVKDMVCDVPLHVNVTVITSAFHDESSSSIYKVKYFYILLRCIIFIFEKFLRHWHRFGCTAAGVLNE